jgi:hypothetical protein
MEQENINDDIKFVKLVSYTQPSKNLEKEGLKITPKT